MISATKRRDWYKVDFQTATPLFGLPGVGFDGTNILAHRSHMPLLATPEAIKIITAPANETKYWEARNVTTRARGFELRVTQHQAIDFITQHNGTLLGDDPRIGKTLSAIMSHDESLGSLVVIAPLSTRGVWLGWIRRVFPELANRIGVITGHKIDPNVLKQPIVFGHYDVIAKWQSLTPIGTLVFDEAHLLTNGKAKRTLAANLLQSRAKRVIAMTGTPVWKLPPDLWSVLGLVAPGAWGAYHEFAYRYGAPVSTAYGTAYTGISHEAELMARLSDVMLRRRWIDVMQDLPAITRSVVVAEVNDLERRKLDILASKLKSERTNTIGNLAAYRRQVTLVKYIDAVQEAEKIMDRDEPVVIWTWHKDYANSIAAALGIRAVVIHGDISPDDREGRIAHWRGQKAGALIATMAVAQVGIDLSHARFAIFAEIDYTPAILGQAEMRTFSPTRPMDIIFIVANHIVDQRIIRALVNKLSAQDSLGVGAACDAIDALRDAIMGPQEVGDLDRLLEDMMGNMD